MKRMPFWLSITFFFTILFLPLLSILGWGMGIPVTRLALAAAVGEVSILISSLIAEERLTSSLRRLADAVVRFSRKDETTPFPDSNLEELSDLGHFLGTVISRMGAELTRVEEERKRLVSILAHLSDGVLIVDGEGMVWLENRAAEEILGISPSDTRRPLAQVVGHHKVLSAWRRCVENGGSYEEILRLVQKDRFVRVVITALSELEGKDCLIVLQDVTEMRRVEEMRKDFVSNISHELRTPLGSLKILSDTLREGALDEPGLASRFLDEMDREIDALIQMVEELLELSRIESGKVPLKMTPVSLEDLVMPPLNGLRPQIERAGLELQVDIPRPAPMVLADPERLPRVVTNLVHNAIKFTPPGGTIRLFARDQEEEVLVGVSDTGVGIPREDIPRIFERFYKSDRSRRSQGTGLGLSISKHLVQSHGGRIWVESEEGRGSTFYFTLRKPGRADAPQN